MRPRCRAAKFGTFVEAERTAAVVYLFRPSAANLQAYQAAVAATDKAKLRPSPPR